VRRVADLPIITSGRMMAAPARAINQPANNVAITLPRLNIDIANEASLMPSPSRLSKIGAHAELVTSIMKAMKKLIHNRIVPAARPMANSCATGTPRACSSFENKRGVGRNRIGWKDSAKQRRDLLCRRGARDQKPDGFQQSRNQCGADEERQHAPRTPTASRTPE
jgi:hypothetical protein